MKSLVLLAVLGVCSAAPFIGDTPEVQAEKARFFQAFRAAQAAATPQQAFQTVAPVQYQWTGPVAATIPARSTAPSPPWLAAQEWPPPATPSSTPTTHSCSPAGLPPKPPQTLKWTGPVAATVPAGVDGTVTPVADTHEVAAARNAFLNAYNAQVRATVGTAPVVPAQVHTFNPVPAVPHQTFHHAAPLQPKWTGPVAATVPAGLPGSAPQVADTAEVAAAKQAFFNAYQRQVAAAARPF
ncbi:cuticle protein CP1499-like [Penaeus japonicus]|uniref:cuticle protein CP1499-like n=1 Tax=Penaeus japonicus TaxID=27405 RepID=UPI001C70CFCF|nr:cuticle protein CP1499-like [Penaeus japonicus]